LLRLSDSLSLEFQPRGLAFLSFAFGVSSSELGWQLLLLLCLGQLLILVLLVFWQAAFSLSIRTFSISFLSFFFELEKGLFESLDLNIIFWLLCFSKTRLNIVTGPVVESASFFQIVEVHH